jgi:circadian clock protein KaiC
MVMAKSSSRPGPSAPNSRASDATSVPKSALKKAPSGIKGFDEITMGGLPKGRPTLIYGGPGCGKTLWGLQFLAVGGGAHGEPGVFLAFEETVDDLKRNARSLGVDLGGLVERQLLTLEHARIEPKEIGEGAYDLDALFMRLARAIDAIQARRVVLDSLEVLLHRTSERAVLRDAFHRLFRWLGNRGVTSIVTAEEGDNGRSRHGFEEYIADCVVRLEHRVLNRQSTRTMRVVKYRGSPHGTNEYPFLIDTGGIHVVPVTSTGLRHKVTSDRVSTGVPRLDTMFDGKGFYRGTTVLISGTPGSGKSSLASHYVAAACARGERVLTFTYEESPEQIVRNMRSIGLDLERWTDEGRLRVIAARPSMYGLEMHLAVMLKAVEDFGPQSVVIDAISNLTRAGDANEAYSVAVRVIDVLKTCGITTVLTHPTDDAASSAHTDLAISSIIDTWILLRALQTGGERHRTLYILKSRGMPHSNQPREFLLSDRGLTLADVYDGLDGVFTGSAGASREAQAKADARRRGPQVAPRDRQRDRRRKAIESQLQDEDAESGADIDQAKAASAQLEREQQAMAKRRRADRDTSPSRDTPPS